MEYARPVWHPSLTTAQAKTLETLQKRAMNIIFPGVDYRLSAIMARVDTRWRTVKRSVIPEGGFLSSLPTARHKRSDIINKLRQPKIFHCCQ